MSENEWIALTFTHWVGCVHNYHEELRAAARELQKQWNRSLNVYFHYSPRFPLLSEMVQQELVRFSKDVPLCCSGASLDDEHGHDIDSPCRRLLDMPGVSLVRIASATPSSQQTHGCVDELICPSARGP